MWACACCRDRLEQLERKRERERKLREQQKEQREQKERERRAEERRKEREARREGARRAGAQWGGAPPVHRGAFPVERQAGLERQPRPLASGAGAVSMCVLWPHLHCAHVASPSSGFWAR